MDIMYRHDRLLRDPYLLLSYHPPPLDNLTIILTGVSNLDLYRAWQTVNSIGNSIRASSVFFLVGVGSLICYKLYSSYSRRGSFSTATSSSKSSPRSQLERDIIDESVDDVSDIQALYFGPDQLTSSGLISEDDDWSGIVGDEEESSDSPSIVSATSSEDWKNMGNKLSQSESRPVRYNQGHVTLPHFTGTSSGRPPIAPPREKRNLKLALNDSTKEPSPGKRARKVIKQYRNIYPTSDRLPPDGLSSASPGDDTSKGVFTPSGFTPGAYTPSPFTPGTQHSQLCRDASIDSSISDFSIDFPSRDVGKGTTEKFRKIQKDISDIQYSCEDLDEDLGSLTEQCSNKDIRKFMKTTYSSYSLADESILSVGPTSSTPDKPTSTPPPPYYMHSPTIPYKKLVKVPRDRQTPSDSPESYQNDSYASLEWDDQACQMYPEETNDVIPGCLRKDIVLPDHLRSFEMDMSSRDNATLSLDNDSALLTNRSTSPSRYNKHTCSSEESGYAEGCDGRSATSIRGPLSPVHEKREPDSIVNKRNKIGLTKGNRDSAYSDGGLDIAMARSAENIGDTIDVVAYGEQEWRGSTDRAITIRQGYRAIPSHVHHKHMRRIRGDNYCGIRSCLFQYLVEGTPVASGSRVYQLLKARPWILNWNFANRLPYTKDNAREGVKKCLQTFDEMVNNMKSTCRDERESKLATLLNCDPDLDVELMEGGKLKMLATAIELYENDSNVSMLAVLLFARDTSTSPRTLMENHLNHVGDSAGIDQLELSLLGASLGARILVVRPSYYGKEEYLSYFPPDDFGVTLPTSHQTLILLAEDDRHYNVIVH